MTRKLKNLIKEENFIKQMNESAKLRALRAHVPTCLACLRAHVPTGLAYLRAHVPTCLACLRAHVLCVLRSVCNFQSTKSPVELNSLLPKFFCYITWLVISPD